MVHIGRAVQQMKQGFKLRRSGWPAKQFVVYMEPLRLPPFSTAGTDRKANDRTAKFIGEDTPLDSLGYFAMFRADGKWQPGWTASTEDLLAEDWITVRSGE